MPSTAMMPQADAFERPGESSLLDVVDILRDSKWLIATITAVGIAVAFVYSLLKPPQYEATALVQVEEGIERTTQSAYSEASRLFDIRSSAQAEISILKSALVLGQVVDQLGLAVDARPKYFWRDESIQVGRFTVPPKIEGKFFSLALIPGGYELRYSGDLILSKGRLGKLETFEVGRGQGQILVTDAVGKPGTEFQLRRIPRDSAIESLQRALKVEEQGGGSGVLRMRLLGNDPLLVKQTLHEIGRVYLRQHLERKSAEADKALKFVETRLPDLRAKIEKAEGRLTRIRKQKPGAFDVTAEGKMALEESARLQATLAELQKKREDLAANYLSDHPSMRSLDSQIQTVRADLAAVQGRIQSFPEIEKEMLSVSRDLKVHSELYMSLLNSAQQIRLAKESRVGNVRVVDDAWHSQDPVSAGTAALLAAGASGGLVAGVLLALLRHGLRRGVQDPAQIESSTSMNVLTTVPYSRSQKVLGNAKQREKGNAKVLAIRSPEDPAVESLRSMRTALQQTIPAARSKIVLITGPTHAVGKSFTSINLAAVLGASGRKVLLIDADMRKGQLNDCFCLPANPGLSEVLADKIRLEDAVHRNVFPNLDFIAAGSRFPSPADALMTRAAEQLVARVSSEYEYVVVDTPPVLAASDAAILAQWAGAVFVVARANVTSVRELHEAGRRLSQRGSRVDGVIFSGLDTSKRRNEIYSVGGYRYAD